MKEGAVLDYENGKKSYSGQVKYHAPPKVARIAYKSTMNITINVINITPDKPGTPVLTRRPFEGESLPALDVTWTRPTDNGNHGIAITGYKVQLQRHTDTEWRDFGRDFAADETGFTLWNLVHGGFYAVQVRALSDAGVSPWSENGWKNANRVPLMANNLPSRDPNVPMTEGRNNCQAGITEQRFTDPDGDTLRIVGATSSHPGIAAASVQEDGTATVCLIHPVSAEITYTVEDGYGGQASRVEPYTGVMNVTRYIAENVRERIEVGAPVSGPPYLFQPIESYSLTGHATNYFEIESSTGQIYMKQYPAAYIDYELKPESTEEG